MTNMENTIRPFAPVPIHPLAAYMPAPIPEGVVECKLGGSGGTTTSFSFDGQTGEVKNAADFKESSRSSSKVRVENSEDPTQFVEFCRADSVKFKQTQAKPSAPSRTSSFDPAGGLHGNSQDRDSSTYEFQYPKDEKTCVSREPPRGGKC